MVADACTRNTGVKVIASLPAEVGGELTSQEGGDVFCLERVHSGAHDGLIEGLEVGLAAEEDISRELHLHEAPVVSTVKVTRDGAEVLGPFIETPMQALGIETIGERLRLLGFSDRQKGIIGSLKGDPCLGQPLSQPMMAIQIDLQAKRCPGGDSNITEAKDLIDEIEVIMQTLARGRLQTGRLPELVMPGSIRRTALHRREDMHQPWGLTAQSQNRLDPLFFAKRPVIADELDFQRSLGGQPLGMGSKHLSQRLRPAGIVKETNTASTQIPGHGFGMTNLRQHAGNHDAVKTREYRADLLLMAFDKGIHGDDSSRFSLPIRQNSTFNTLVPAMPG